MKKLVADDPGLVKRIATLESTLELAAKPVELLAGFETQLAVIAAFKDRELDIPVVGRVNVWQKLTEVASSLTSVDKALLSSRNLARDVAPLARDMESLRKAAAGFQGLWAIAEGSDKPDDIAQFAENASALASGARLLKSISTRVDTVSSTLAVPLMTARSAVDAAESVPYVGTYVKELLAVLVAAEAIFAGGTLSKAAGTTSKVLEDLEKLDAIAKTLAACSG